MSAEIKMDVNYAVQVKKNCDATDVDAGVEIWSFEEGTRENLLYIPRGDECEMKMTSLEFEDDQS